MRKIRVLVVDDSVVMRRVLTDLISADPELEVIGVANNGKMALAKLGQLQPDVVTLDVEMPELDGLGTLRELRRQWPRLPVIMFSSLTQRGAAATVEALTLGANDYVSKPAGNGNLGGAMAQVRAQLLPRIKSLCPRPDAAAHVSAQATEIRTAPARAPGSPPVGVLAIGASTGGPNALATLLPQLPKGLAVPILIVQHMPAQFTPLLADRLAQLCPFPVEQARLGGELRPGVAFIAPGNFHMRVQAAARPRVSLDQTPPRNSCRPAVDVLFESVAQLYGAAALGVILTGMGQDGVRGAELIREAGGEVLAQDQASSVVWGMPGLVARRGVASEVLPLGALAEAIVRRLRGRTLPATALREAAR